MIFTHLLYESVVQASDKLRLNASKSFSNQGAITNIEIEPDTGVGFISIFNTNNEKWFIDWAYGTAGAKVISVRITTDAPATVTDTYDLEVISAADDNLFSSDNDLFPFEPNLSRFLPPGKSSFKYAHRAAQEKILAWLDEQKIWKKDGTRFEKSDIVDSLDFKRWSIFQTLLIIFESNQLTTNDIFEEKRQGYESDLIEARNRASLRLDLDVDGVIDETEKVSLQFAPLYRR